MDSYHKSLQWRHYDQDGVSNHQPRGCILNRLFRRRSKKTSKLRVTGLCVGNSRGPVNSPHKGPVTRKMFPFDDVIMDKAMVRPSYFYNGILIPAKNIFIWKRGPDGRITSHERRGVSNHRLLHCLFNSFTRLTTKTTLKLHITDPLWGNPPVTLHRTSNAESGSMGCSYHGYR